MRTIKGVDVNCGHEINCGNVESPLVNNELWEYLKAMTPVGITLHQLKHEVKTNFFFRAIFFSFGLFLFF